MGRFVAAAALALLVAGCDVARPRPEPTPTSFHQVEYRFGRTWDAPDGKVQIYERSGWLWLDVRDRAGSLAAHPPAFTVIGPEELEAPKLFDVQKDAAGRYFTRVRFYDPGADYRLSVQTQLPGGASESAVFDLPEVRPNHQLVGDFGLEYTATPALGRPKQPALLTVRARGPEGQAQDLAAPPRIEVVNPCGWGPAGTLSAVPGEVGAYAWEIPSDEVIDVTGIYKLRVYPLTDPASYVEYLYETRN